MAVLAKKKAVLWDLDGTLINSEEIAFEANKRVFFDLFGKKFTHQHNAVMHGRLQKDTIERVMAMMRIQYDWKALMKEQYRVFTDLIAEGVPFIDGITDILFALHKKGFKQAVVTASPRFQTEISLNKNGFATFFDAVITQDDVLDTKPSPEAYKLALEQLNLLPNDAVVVEDSSYGIMAAKKSGCTCIQVLYSGAERFDMADNWVLSSNELKKILI